MTKFGRQLIEGANEALAIARGEITPARIVVDTASAADDATAELSTKRGARNAMQEQQRGSARAGKRRKFTPVAAIPRRNGTRPTTHP